ncbi:MAG: methyl-accepting chemotaxis protein, partial [Candidatus Hydrogenedentales bacterium]
MFAKSSLTIRILAGVSIIIFGTIVLGFSGWWQVKRIAGIVELNEQGTQCQVLLGKAGFLRRDIMAQSIDLGVESDATVKVDLPTKWKDNNAALGTLFQQIGGTPGLTPAALQRVESAQEALLGYATAFDEMIAARQSRDKAFQRLSKAGWSITATIGDIRQKTIAPAIQAARTANDLALFAQCYDQETSFSTNVVEQFFLLRVRALYLTAFLTEESATAALQQAEAMSKGLDAWAQSGAQNAQMTQTVDSLRNDIREYQEGLKQFYAGVEKQQATDEKMAASGSAVDASIKDLGKELQNETNAIITQTVFVALVMMLAVSLGGMLVAVL